MSKKSSNTEIDVLIVGAGIVGQTLALALAQKQFDKADLPRNTASELNVSQLNIVVLDSSKDLPLSESTVDVFSARVSAISLASQKTFESLKVWSSVSRKQAYSNMQVWEQDAFGSIDFAAQDINQACLGHIVENEQLSHSLYLACTEHKNVQHVLGHAIEQIEKCDAGYQVRLDNGDILITKLLVGADGAHSFVRAQMGFTQTFWDYDHCAIVANVKTQEPHLQTAYQAFSPNGPLAFLPLPDSHQCSIVWSQDTNVAKTLLDASEQEFCKALAVAIDTRLGTCTLSTNRTAFPLRMRYSRQWVDESVVLVGDAAHTIHPLAGQGANLGIADAVALADNIANSIANNKPFYSKAELRAYERFRKAEAQKVIATMEGFKQLFSGESATKKLLRNIGLSAANRFNPIKQFFIDQASG